MKKSSTVLSTLVGVTPPAPERSMAKTLFHWSPKPVRPPHVTTPMFAGMTVAGTVDLHRLVSGGETADQSLPACRRRETQAQTEATTSLREGSELGTPPLPPQLFRAPLG